MFANINNQHPLKKINMELSAHELRIGNLVYYRDKDWITLFVSNIGNTFETVNSDGILYGSDDINEYNPVPLTEDWLIKLGFEKDEYEYSYDLLSMNIRFYEDEFYYNPISEYFPAYAISIQYVHELQNLYFALTGEELKLS